MFTQIKLYIYSAVALACVLFLAYTHYLAYSFGENIEVVKYEKILTQIKTASAEETSRQAAANTAALEVFNQKILDLQSANSNLERLVTNNAIAAAKDPNANKPCLGPSSVLRIDSVRGKQTSVSVRTKHRLQRSSGIAKERFDSIASRILLVKGPL